MSYKIEDIARAGCTTPRGVRYWEEQGLLKNVKRTAGNQRTYTPDHFARAKIIAACQFGRFELKQIKKMVEEYTPETHEAITYRLASQAEAADRLANALPVPAQSEFDL